MDQKDWILMKTLYEEKNMTRAANKLFVSQPSLSYRLKNLEEEFSVSLFYKTKNGLEFTTEGEYLVQHSVRMLNELQTTKDEVLNIQKEIIGTLRIGVSSNFARYLLPSLLKGFSAQYPKVQFHVYTGLSTEVMDLLNKSSVQVGIVRSDYAWQGTKYLLKDELFFIISKNEIDVNKLPEYPMINYKTDSLLKEEMTHWWNDQYVKPPNIEMEVDRLDTCIEMVKIGFGYAVVPAVCLQECKHEELYQFPVHYKDGTALKRKTWLMFNESSMMLSVVRHFVDYLKNGVGNEK